VVVAKVMVLLQAVVVAKVMVLLQAVVVALARGVQMWVPMQN